MHFSPGFADIMTIPMSHLGGCTAVTSQRTVFCEWIERPQVLSAPRKYLRTDHHSLVPAYLNRTSPSLQKCYKFFESYAVHLYQPPL